MSGWVEVALCVQTGFATHSNSLLHDRFLQNLFVLTGTGCVRVVYLEAFTEKKRKKKQSRGIELGRLDGHRLRSI